MIHNYKVIEQLGKGAFSTVFKGLHRIHQTPVALKVSSEKQTHETKILAYLNRELARNNPCVPTLLWYGLFGNNTCIVTTFFETTFQNYVDSVWNKDCQGLWGICNQLMGAIEKIHSVHIVHSDIKPDNFMVDGGRVYIIDFGLSSLVYNVDKGVFKENKKTEHLIGSPKFASYNLHLGNSVSYRDDLISVGYMMMTMFRIEIPWANMVLLDGEEDGDLPLYHVAHPLNIRRARYKQLKTLLSYIESLSVEMPGVKEYLIEYFQKTYALSFIGEPTVRH